MRRRRSARPSSATQRTSRSTSAWSIICDWARFIAMDSLTDTTAAEDERALRIFARRLERTLAAMLDRLTHTALSLSVAGGRESAAAFCDLSGRVVAESGCDPILVG